MSTITSVAVFVKNLTSGGAEKQSVLLALALAGEYDVHYIVFNGRKVHQKYMDMLLGDDRIKAKTFTGGHLSRFCKLIKYLRKERIDCIFSYLTAANLYACMAGNISGAKVFTGLRNAQLPLGRMIADRFLTNTFATAAIANCYSGKEEFVRKGFKADKIVVIPNCFLNISPYSEKPKREIPVIITVGRFVAQKDYETAIKSVAILKRNGHKCQFRIVGYGELESDVRRWVLENDIADITTIYINPDNIQELEMDADIYISTSLFEGTSNSIMEGMDANLPIVATNVGDNKHLVEDGVNGFLCHVGNTEQISSCLAKLIENYDLRTFMGKKSKEKLREKFGMEIFKDRYLTTTGDNTLNTNNIAIGGG